MAVRRIRCLPDRHQGTWDLHEAYEWSTTAFVAIVVVMVLACIVNTITRIQRRQAILDQARPD